MIKYKFRKDTWGEVQHEVDGLAAAPIPADLVPLLDALALKMMGWPADWCGFGGKLCRTVPTRLWALAEFAWGRWDMIAVGGEDELIWDGETLDTGLLVEQLFWENPVDLPAEWAAEIAANCDELWDVALAKHMGDRSAVVEWVDGEQFDAVREWYGRLGKDIYELFKVLDGENHDADGHVVIGWIE